MKKSEINFNHFKSTPTNVTFFIFLMLFSFSACKDEACLYSVPCVETCDLFEDFDDAEINTSGNWSTVNAFAAFQVSPGTGSNTLYLQDLSGASWVFNDTDFPTDMVAAGCALEYDIEFLAGTSNLAAASNSLVIYQGLDPATATTRASFVLNSSSLIVSGSGLNHIVVPLALASGSSLPSNAFGEWRLLGGSATPTPTDIANFNALILNISGVAFFADNGANPAEQWWYDNFCFKQCCR